MRFTDDALDMLDAYDWPGNVRELENTIQRACALCNSDVLLPSDIPLGSKGSRHHSPTSTVTRMRDALSMLISIAETSPDIELLPWVERELSRLAYRHFAEDPERTTRFLGVDNALLQSHLSAPAVKKAPLESPAAPAVKKTRKAS
jgi:DNA-binding NtrC family response regulator